jgi:arylsulfatase A-like enzyme
MKNLIFPRSLLLISTSLFLFSFQKESSKTKENGYPDRPNIVWIVTEDMSPQHLGVYGGTGGKTPVLDAFATESVRYTNLFSTAGVCAPSRASIITGAYQTGIGGQHMRTLGMSAAASDVYPPGFKAYSAMLPEGMKGFPEYLRMAGYYVTNNAKQDYQFVAPATLWDESSRKGHWRNRPDKNQPFFSVFNIEVTHESQVWMRANQPLLVDPAEVRIPPYYPDDSISRAVMARFISNVMTMDSQVGEILKQLKEDGLYENTIIFFYSDHGDGLPYAKREMYDRGLRAPLMIKAPFLEPGTVDVQLISFVDFGPTVLSLAGLEIPESIQGQAFLGKQKSETPRKYIYAGRDRMDSEYDRVRAVSDGRYKYIRNYMPEKPNYQNVRYRLQNPLMPHLLKLNEEGKLTPDQARWFAPSKPLEEFYDTQTDPYEFKNLVGNPAYEEKLKELRAAHEQWMKEYPDMSSIPEMEMVRNWWGGKDEAPITAEPKVEFAGGKVSISSATKGASIGYRKSTKDVWTIFQKPIEMQAGDSLYVLAHRIGFEPSVKSMVLK